MEKKMAKKIKKVKKVVEKVKKIKISKLQKKKNDPSSTLWKKKADRAFSKIALSGGKCAYCGKTEFLDTAHMLPRENLAVRWDLTNYLVLCKSCHKWNMQHSFHRNPLVFFIWLMDTHPEVIEKTRINMGKAITETPKEAFLRLEKYAKDNNIKL